jgi:hypothetical protein
LPQLGLFLDCAHRIEAIKVAAMTRETKSKMKPALSPAIIFSEKIIREAGTGKLSVIISFQKFIGPTFPFAVPPFVVTVSIGQLSGKLEKLKLAVEIVNETGEAIIPPVTAEVGTENEVSPDEIFEFSFPIPPCQFAAPGMHDVIFLIGDVIAGKRTLPVIQSEPFPPQAQAATPPSDSQPEASEAADDGRKSESKE